MGFFSKAIITKERKKALDEFRKHALSALDELMGQAPDALTKQLYERMAQNVANTPIYFYPRKVLRAEAAITPFGSLVSVVKGENVSAIRIFQSAGRKFAVMSSYINLPSEHIFEGNKLSIGGLFTLAHEYGHFPKSALGRFAEKYNMPYGTAEELFADILSAKLAVKLGFPKERALEHFAGREIVYGSVPFRKFILKSIS